MKSFFQLLDSCLADCKFLLVKTLFYRTVLYVLIVMDFVAGRLSDTIKYFVSQNKILLVLTDRPALFVKTAPGERASEVLGLIPTQGAMLCPCQSKTH